MNDQEKRPQPAEEEGVKVQIIDARDLASSLMDSQPNQDAQSPTPEAEIIFELGKEVTLKTGLVLSDYETSPNQGSLTQVLEKGTRIVLVSTIVDGTQQSVMETFPLDPRNESSRKSQRESQEPERNTTFRINGSQYATFNGTPAQVVKAHDYRLPPLPEHNPGTGPAWHEAVERIKAASVRPLQS
ncbi:MAG: hypothetical protein AAB373_06775 [Patescibacteria group bacterium]